MSSLDKVREFRVASGQVAPEGLKMPSRGDRELLIRLLLEEVCELAEELGVDFEAAVQGRIRRPVTAVCEHEVKCIAHVCKEAADVKYVADQLFVAMGIPEAVFDEVHASNMSKFVDGRPVKRPDGKTMKGPHYRPANIARALGLDV